MIKVRNLIKKYGNLTAVDGIEFSVKPREIFGFLGPNGAGKTTTLEMIEGLRKPDGGDIHIKDIPVWPNPNRIKNLIGVQLQATAFYEEVTVKETLLLFAALYGRKLSKSKLTELLDIVGLTEKQNSYSDSLSGGQKQRLAIVTTLINDPEIIFLDEPTTGLDPQARRRIWDIVKDFRESGKTVVMTTHYMEEAEALCDRVAVIDQGKIIALDTPQALIDNLGAEAKISFSSSLPISNETLLRTGINSVKDIMDNGKQVVYSSDASLTVSLLLSHAKDNNFSIKDLHISSATLEDVFLALTGKELRD